MEQYGKVKIIKTLEQYGKVQIFKTLEQYGKDQTFVLGQLSWGLLMSSIYLYNWIQAGSMKSKYCLNNYRCHWLRGFMVICKH